MRVSRYNLAVPSDRGGLLVFNAWTCALVSLQPGFYGRFLDPGTGDPNLAPPQVQKELLRGHFAVPDGVDELEQYRFERARSCYATDRLDLVIAPTLDCNLACVYCYEETRRPGVMGPAVVQAVKDFVDRRLRSISSLGVAWYGGEPLLALDVISDLQGWFRARARERGVALQAQLYTNGVLLRPEVARALVQLGIGSAQVNLDGPADVHDRRRPQLGGGGTFETILHHLLSVPAGLEMNIRIGIDLQNQDRAWELYDTLWRLGLAGRHRVSLAPIMDVPGVCRSAAASCMGLQGFLSWCVAGLRRRLEAGLPVAGVAGFYPGPGFGCMATRLGEVMVDPEGLMQRCVEEAGLRERSVGSIDRPLEFGAVLQEWLSLDPLAIPRCRECRLLPLCKGGCPRGWLREGQPQCSPYAGILEEVVRLRDIWPEEKPRSA